MKTTWLVLVVLVCASNQAVAARRATDKARSIVWVDDTTGHVLFSAADIVRFDWEKQAFELKRDRAMDLEARLASVPGPHGRAALKTAEGYIYPDREFSVRDRRGTIYRGALVTRASHVSYSGPAILIDELSFRGNPVLRIQGGYPTGSDRTRVSPRLRQDLKEAGVLGNISDSYRPKPIEAFQLVGSDGEGLVVSAKLFTETIRPGRLARMHLRFSHDEKYRASWDDVQVVITLSASHGRFQGIAREKGPSSPADAPGAYVIWFSPWKPTSRSLDPVAKAGLARVRVHLVLRKKIGRAFTPIQTLAFGSRVIVLPQQHRTATRSGGTTRGRRPRRTSAWPATPGTTSSSRRVAPPPAPGKARPQGSGGRP